MCSGVSAEANCEAHGGYVFCGVAALFILRRLDLLDIPALTGWLARRQMSFEGGFSGRANKLVDGCYSFWQGGASAIASSFYASGDHTNDPWLERQGDEALGFSLLFDAPMLERYILLCAQGELCFNQASTVQREHLTLASIFRYSWWIARQAEQAKGFLSLLLQFEWFVGCTALRFWRRSIR